MNINAKYRLHVFIKQRLNIKNYDTPIREVVENDFLQVIRYISNNANEYGHGYA